MITLEDTKNITPLDKKIPLDEFQEIRRQVLQTWPTGAEVSLEEAVAYQRAYPRPNASPGPCPRPRPGGGFSSSPGRAWP